MIYVKGLLLDPLPSPHAPTILQDSSFTHPASQNNYPANNPQLSCSNTRLRAHSTRSITPPTTICFQPTIKKPLTKSTPSCSSYVPSNPSPLSTYTHCQPSISPTDSFPRCHKKRKIAIPPSVYYNASTKVSQPTPIAPPAPTTKPTLWSGRHVWLTNNPLVPDEHVWWDKWQAEAHEYKIIHADFDSPCQMKHVKTGQVFNIEFSKAEVLFKNLDESGKFICHNVHFF